MNYKYLGCILKIVKARRFYIYAETNRGAFLLQSIQPASISAAVLNSTFETIEPNERVFVWTLKQYNSIRWTLAF